MLARKWCSPCHSVNGGQADASDVAPPFAQIANEPATTAEQLAAEQLAAEQLAAWLAALHPPMPDLNLSHDKIDDLIAHIESLKTA